MKSDHISASSFLRPREIITGLLFFALGVLIGYVSIPSSASGDYSLATEYLNFGAQNDPVTSDTDEGVMSEETEIAIEAASYSDNNQIKPVDDDNKEVFEEDPLIQKTDFMEIDLPLMKTEPGSKPKLFFFAGVAYSGHDLIEKAIMKSCAASPGKCVSLCDNVIDPMIFYAGSTTKYASARKATEEALSTLAKNAVSDKVYIGNLYGKCSISTTYPDLARSGTSQRSHFHPDMFLLADIAERTGWNLQVIVLLRDVQFLSQQFLDNHDKIGLTEKGKKRRDIGVLKLMEMSMQNLYSQISMIDRGFYFCYSFDHISGTDVGKESMSVAGASKLSKIMNLANFDTNIAEEYSAQVQNKDTHSSGTTLGEGTQLFIKTLKFLRQSMNTMCTQKKRNINNLFIGNDQQKISSELVPRPFGLSSVLKKTKFDGPRLVFFAGLEGTGHHLWQGLVMELLHSGNLNADCKLNSLFMSPTGGCWDPYHDGKPFFCAAMANSFKTGYENAEIGLKNFMASGATGTHMMNLVKRGQWDGNCGSLASYPCFSGRDKAMQKPDVLKLAEICERVGIDFRVVILQRNTVELVVSDIWHRHFNMGHPKMFEERVLENNAGSLYTQTALLDPSFYSCTQFDDSTFNAAERVGSLMQVPTLKSILQSRMHAEKANASIHIPNEDYRFIHTLRAFNSAIQDLCSKSKGHL